MRSTRSAKDFGARACWIPISIRFEARRFTSLLGPSGSGKTTLLRIVAGFVAPDAGKVRIGDEDVTGVPVWKRSIGMVFQSYALFPHMSVAENVVFGLNRRGVRGAAAAKEVTRGAGPGAPVRLRGAAARSSCPAGSSSASRWPAPSSPSPTVLLLDEPLSALDRRLRQEMQVELRRIQRESGLTTIFVTHDQEEALTLSDHVAILDNGRIVQDGAPARDLRAAAHALCRRLSWATRIFSRARSLTGGVEVPGGGIVRTADALPPIGIDSDAGGPAGEDDAASLAPDTAHSVDNVMPATHPLDDLCRRGLDLSARPGRTGCELKVFAQNRAGAPGAIGDEVLLGWAAEHTILVED